MATTRVSCQISNTTATPYGELKFIYAELKGLITKKVGQDTVQAEDWRTEERLVSVGSEPRSLAPFRNSGTDYVCVANSGSDNISLISYDKQDVRRVAATNQKFSAQCKKPVSISGDPLGDYIAVANHGSSSVAMLSSPNWNTAKEPSVASLLVNTSPTIVAFDPQGAYVAVAVAGEQKVILAALDRGNVNESSLIPIAFQAPGFLEPQWLSISPDGSKISLLCPTESLDDGAAVWITVDRANMTHSKASEHIPVGISVANAIPSRAATISLDL
ncbi:YncE family protein [Streptomyces wuyuanensis]|uniref:YncE family protein n=1 Tax=Streptomyces wuyuanensis TaxID=1196353 RepID=UPI0034327459